MPICPTCQAWFHTVDPERVYCSPNCQAKGAPAGRDTRSHKLTPQQVRAIRERYAAGGVSMRALGTEYGVSRTAILQVVKRRTYAA